MKHTQGPIRGSVSDDEAAPLLTQIVQRPASVLGSSDGKAVESSCSATKAVDSSEGGGPRTCRICFETEDPSCTEPEPDNPLISPCLCSGSSRYVHRRCLQQWRTSNHRADSSYQCEVCKFCYQYRRLWWATLLGHKATVMTSFVALVTGLTWVLGYIPLTPPAAADKVGWGVTHVVNGIVVMGILGVVLTLTMLICRAFGITTFWFVPDTFLHGCCLCCTECSGPSLFWGDLTVVGAECGLAFLSLLAIVTICMGFIMSCYMLYGVLWALNSHILERAQLMVENVAPPPAAAAAAGGGGAAAHSTNSSSSSSRAGGGALMAGRSPRALAVTDRLTNCAEQQC